MGNITPTTNLLNAKSERVNMALLCDDLLTAAEMRLDLELELFADYFAEENEKDLGTWLRENAASFEDEVSWDWTDIFHYAGRNLAEYLEHRYPLLFGPGGPVRLSDYIQETSRPATGLWGQEQDAQMFEWTINGNALLGLFKDLTGKTEVRDGHGISGFIRTCEDSYWVQCEVIRECMEALDDNGWVDPYEYLEYLSDYIDFGRLAGMVD